MSYSAVGQVPHYGSRRIYSQIAPLGQEPVASADEPMSGGKVALLVVGGTVILGIIGFAIYADYKVSRDIAQKEGSTGLLKYQGGKAAIGLASAYLSPRDR